MTVWIINHSDWVWEDNRLEKHPSPNPAEQGLGLWTVLGVIITDALKRWPGTRQTGVKKKIDFVPLKIKFSKEGNAYFFFKLKHLWRIPKSNRSLSCHWTYHKPLQLSHMMTSRCAYSYFYPVNIFSRLLKKMRRTCAPRTEAFNKEMHWRQRTVSMSKLNPILMYT